tara:strand:+ start:2791 stop:3054 length:264 start_codon:yes stop_codon:yes gene_type:complete
MNLKTYNNMRIEFSTLREIDKELGPIEIGAQTRDQLTIRFGYWNSVDLEKLHSLLPHYIQAIENLVDEDDDTGSLWDYTLRRSHIKI